MNPHNIYTQCDGWAKGLNNLLTLASGGNEGGDAVNAEGCRRVVDVWSLLLVAGCDIDLDFGDEQGEDDDMAYPDAYGDVSPRCGDDDDTMDCDGTADGDEVR